MAATFLALSPVSAFAANKVQFVLHNANVDGWEVRLLRLSLLPQATAVTGVLPSEWTLRRRNGTTTPPSGTGSIVPVALDTDAPLKSGITVWNAPQVAPSGGTLDVVSMFVPQPDEMKLTTADAPSMAALHPADGMVIYSAPSDGLSGITPLTIHQNQTLELVQSGTGGTGNCRIRALFLVGAL